MSDPTTFEAARPALEHRSFRREPPRNRAEASKWLGGRHSLITRHVATLRKLLA